MHSAPVSVFGDVRGFRQEEPEKRFSLEPAGLCDRKETEVVAGTLFAERSGDLPLYGVGSTVRIEKRGQPRAVRS